MAEDYNQSRMRRSRTFYTLFRLCEGLCSGSQIVVLSLLQTQTLYLNYAFYNSIIRFDFANSSCNYFVFPLSSVRHIPLPPKPVLTTHLLLFQRYKNYIWWNRTLTSRSTWSRTKFSDEILHITFLSSTICQISFQP